MPCMCVVLLSEANGAVREIQIKQTTLQIFTDKISAYQRRSLFFLCPENKLSRT
jgi:hypothetical protein